jgi:glycosyltransferase involved in cell wall biosynthesis
MSHYVRRVTKQVISGACCSFFVGEELKKAYAVHAVPALAYHDATHSASDVKKVQKWRHNKPLNLLFVGELSKAKGVDALLRAGEKLVAQGRQVTLTFIGRGPEETTLTQKQLSGLTINLCGWIAHGEEFDAAFDDASALVLPSLTEGVPRVVVEAMVRAVPVIASDVGDISNLLRGGENGWLVKPGDAEGIVDAVGDIIRNRENAMQRVRKASSYVAKYDRVYWKEKINSKLLNTLEAGR